PLVFGKQTLPGGLNNAFPCLSENIGNGFLKTSLDAVRKHRARETYEVERGKHTRSSEVF
ncbi:hypothetical protein, partial [Candidatus Electronema sp. TJ]|uniref:hypothetical protein n=1 Tax=Candidatus Electronema sp. TJ TaxID=3401573 RepID=UPI003AA94DCB